MLSGEFSKNLVSSTNRGAVMLKLSPLRNTVEALVLARLAEKVNVCPPTPFSKDEVKLMVIDPAKAHAEKSAKSGSKRKMVLLDMFASFV
jgi:hypothetical protein